MAWTWIFLPLGFRRAQHFANQRTDELFERDDGRNRVSGHAEHRLLLHLAHEDRLSGHHGDPVDQDFSQLGHRRLGEVLGSGRRSPHGHDNLVVVLQGFVHRLLNLGDVIDHNFSLDEFSPRRFHQLPQHVGIGFQHLSWLEVGQVHAPPVPDLRPGGNDQHARLFPHFYFEHAAGEQRPQAIGGHRVVSGKQQFRGHDVLPHLSDVLPGKRRADDLQPVVVQGVDVFDHDHGVGPLRKHMPGIDEKRVFILDQHLGTGFAGAERLLGVHRDAVHGRRVKVGRGQLREHRFRQHPSHRIRRCHSLGPHGFDMRKPLEQSLPCFVHGFHLQVDISFRSHLHYLLNSRQHSQPPCFRDLFF